MFFISVGQPTVNADRSGIWIFVFILPSFFVLFLIFACSFVSPCFDFPKEEIKCLKDKTEKAMAIHSSSIAWKIPWTGAPGGLQSMGSLRVGHDWATSLYSLHSLHTLELEKEMATDSSILAWRIPWTEESGHGPWGHRESDTTKVSEHACIQR